MNWTKRFLLTCLLAFTPILGAAQTLVNCAPATPCTMAGPSNTNTGDRAWLAFGKINTDLLVLAPLFNSTGLPFTLPVTSGGTGAITLTGLIKGNGTSAFSAATSADVISRWSGTCNATTFLRADGSCQAVGGGSVTITGSPANGNLTKFSGAASITSGDLSGDCTTSGSLAITCTKTGGVSFATSATTDATSATNITSGQLPSLARLPSIVNNTLLGNVSGSTTVPAAVTLSVLGIGDTPLKEGAVGNGIANDTTPVQACVNTGYCLLPAGYNFLVSSPIQIPNGGTLIGQSVRTSVITGNAVVGGVIQIGDGVTVTGRVTVKNFRLLGTATNAVKVNTAIPVILDNIFAGSDNGESNNPTWTDAFWFNETFDGSFTNLHTNGATILHTATFTASVGGATSGTLTVSTPSDIYDFVFSNGDRRVVTVTAGTTATWSVALTAGTVTTAWYGSCFRIGRAWNNNYAANWLTSNTAAYNFYLGSDPVGTDASAGSVFDALAAQGGIVGLYVGTGHTNHTFNSFYSEQTAMPIVLGNFVGDSGATTGILTFNSPLFGGPSVSNPGYALRVAALNLDSISGLVMNSPNLGQAVFGLDTVAPLTFSGGGASIQAKGVGLANAAGAVRAAVVTFPGIGYTSNPTVAVGGAGTGATVTAVQSSGIITTANLTLSAGGSGYTGPGAMPILYNNAANILINSPTIFNRAIWPWVVHGPNANGAGITILNDNVSVYAGDAGQVSADLTRANNPGGYGYAHWLTYLTGVGPQGTNPTPTYVLVNPPAFP